MLRMSKTEHLESEQGNRGQKVTNGILFNEHLIELTRMITCEMIR